LKSGASLTAAQSFVRSREIVEGSKGGEFLRGLQTSDPTHRPKRTAPAVLRQCVSTPGGVSPPCLAASGEQSADARQPLATVATVARMSKL
jgi:hypothetical protein